MPKLWMTVFGLLILAPAAVAVPVPEYSGPRPRGLVLVSPFLLQRPGVQEELKLSREQVEKIAELKEKYRQTLRETSRDEIRQKIQELAAAQQKALAQILTRRQLARAEQISLQLLGPLAFIRPQVASALGLSSEQQEKMKAIGAEFRSETREALRGEGRSRTELLKIRNEKMMDVLTPAQKEKWKILTGPPFVASPPPRDQPPGRP
jgi:hypothetical protein